MTFLGCAGLVLRAMAHPFGLAGLEGFFHYFLVAIRACDGYLDIEPQP